MTGLTSNCPCCAPPWAWNIAKRTVPITVAKLNQTTGKVMWFGDHGDTVYDAKVDNRGYTYTCGARTNVIDRGGNPNTAPMNNTIQWIYMSPRKDSTTQFGETFKLIFNGSTTAPIVSDQSNTGTRTANALALLPSVGAGNVRCTAYFVGIIGFMLRVEFLNSLANVPLPLIQVVAPAGRDSKVTGFQTSGQFSTIRIYDPSGRLHLSVDDGSDIDLYASGFYPNRRIAPHPTDGSFVVTTWGCYNPAGFVNIAQLPNLQGTITKYDASGNLIWRKHPNGLTFAATGGAATFPSNSPVPNTLLDVKVLADGDIDCIFTTLPYSPYVKWDLTSAFDSITANGIGLLSGVNMSPLIARLNSSGNVTRRDSFANGIAIVGMTHQLDSNPIVAYNYVVFQLGNGLPQFPNVGHVLCLTPLDRPDITPIGLWAQVWARPEPNLNSQGVADPLQPYKPPFMEKTWINALASNSKGAFVGTDGNSGLDPMVAMISQSDGDVPVWTFNFSSTDPTLNAPITALAANEFFVFAKPGPIILKIDTELIDPNAGVWAWHTYQYNTGYPILKLNADTGALVDIISDPLFPASNSICLDPTDNNLVVAGFRSTIVD